MAHNIKTLFESLCCRNSAHSLVDFILQLKTPTNDFIEYDFDASEVYVAKPSCQCRWPFLTIENRSYIIFNEEPILLTSTGNNMSFAITISTTQKELDDYIGLSGQDANIIVHFDESHLGKKQSYFRMDDREISANASKKDFEKFIEHIDKHLLQFCYQLGKSAEQAGVVLNKN